MSRNDVTQVVDLDRKANARVSAADVIHKHLKYLLMYYLKTLKLVEEKAHD